MWKILVFFGGNNTIYCVFNTARHSWYLCESQNSCEQCIHPQNSWRHRGKSKNTLLRTDQTQNVITHDNYFWPETNNPWNHIPKILYLPGLKKLSLHEHTNLGIWPSHLSSQCWETVLNEEESTFIITLFSANKHIIYFGNEGTSHIPTSKMTFKFI